MDTNRIPVVELNGPPGDRGYAYGSAVAELVASVIQSIDKRTRSSMGEPVDEFWKTLLARTDYLSAAKQYCPELVEEVAGIADGSGLSFETAFALQLMDEDYHYRALRRSQKAIEMCSAFAAPMSDADGFVAGQNMDIPLWSDNHQTLLRVTDDTTNVQSLVFTYAGMIGLNGVNNFRIGITCNSLHMLSENTGGLPVSFFVRAALSKETISDAEALITEVPHACGQNYILSSPERIRSFECSGAGISEYCAANSPILLHTNHILADHSSSHYNDGADGRRFAEENSNDIENSKARLVGLARHFVDQRQVSVSVAKAALSDKTHPQYPVCINPGPGSNDRLVGFTSGSSIYEVGDRIVLHLASGPPDVTEYLEFELTPA